MDQPESVKLKLSSKIGRKAPVLVAEFSNGQLDDETKVQFECFKAEDQECEIENRVSKRKLMATNGRLTYIGESNDSSALRYLIGVRNKNTGKMKLYDSTHFCLKPVLTSNNTHVSNNTDKEKDFWEERNKLTEEFGGKTQKRILKARQRLAVKVDSSDGFLNDDSMGASPLPNNPFAKSQSVSYLPSANKNAQTPDQVFEISDIITPDIDASLSDQANSWLEAFKTDAVAAKLNFCKFALNRIDKMMHDSDKLKYLIYYNYLVVFNQLTYAELRRKDPAPSIPEPFKGSMLKIFTSEVRNESGRTQRNFPPTHRDKLISHLIVVALLIDDYCVRISDILADLKRAPKQFTNIAHALGCFITSKKVDDHNDKFVELKIPLNVVLPRFSKRLY